MERHGYLTEDVILVEKEENVFMVIHLTAISTIGGIVVVQEILMHMAIGTSAIVDGTGSSGATAIGNSSHAGANSALAGITHFRIMFPIEN